MNILEVFEELDRLEENGLSRAAIAFSNGDWTQERIDACGNYYTLARELGYNPNGNIVSDATRRSIRQAAEANNFRINFKSSVPDGPMSDDEWFIKGVKRNGTHTVRRIKDHGLKPYECAICGNNGWWNGKELVLQVHHIDGDHYNNEKSNLQLLCPNCHSQTESYARMRKSTEEFD